MVGQMGYDRLQIYERVTETTRCGVAVTDFVLRAVDCASMCKFLLELPIFRESENGTVLTDAISPFCFKIIEAKDVLEPTRAILIF